MKKLQTFELSCFRGKNYFENDGTQNYLVFQPRTKYFKKISNTDHVSEWKSKGLSDEIIKPPATSDNVLAPALNYVCNKIRVKFHGGCLKQGKITYTHGKIVNICIVYALSSNLNSFDFALGNCLFGAVKLTKNTDIDKYTYSGYGTGFDSRGFFLFPSDEFAKNVIIFGFDMSSSVHIDNKKKDVLILGECHTQRLDGTTLTAEKSIQLISLLVKENFV